VLQSVFVGGFLCVALALWIRLGPIPPELLDLDDATSTVVVDRHGVPLYEARSAAGTRSIRLDATSLPPVLVAATVAAEDRRFWSHPGLDARAILRAARQNLVENRIVEGGSTISQQVAKLLLNRRLPTRSRGCARRCRKRCSRSVSSTDSTNARFWRYLNLASTAIRSSAPDAPARPTLAATSSMLTPAQAAFLAGLLQRPSGYNPYRNRASAIARQQSVLRRMRTAGALTEEQLREARDERLSLVRASSPFLAPHFVEMVLAHAGDRRPSRIETSLDAALQTDISGIITSQRASLDRHGAYNVAVVVLDNARGEWLAWEGSGDYADAEHGGAINGATALRQPGSALKPFTYALAFEQGVTPATVLADVPSHFPTAEPGVLYIPRNYDGRYRGPLLARKALAGSENVPAVALASEIGVPTLQRFLTRAGLSTFDRTPSFYGLGLTLGNAEVRLDELVAGYAAFARGGDWLQPTWSPVGRGTDNREHRPLVSPRTAYWITDILSDHDAREFIFGRGGHLEFHFQWPSRREPRRPTTTTGPLATRGR
jgi:penicillin-binding protein 1C